MPIAPHSSASSSTTTIEPASNASGTRRPSRPSPIFRDRTLSQGRRWPCHPHTPALISSVSRKAPSRIWRVQLPRLSCKDAGRTLPFPLHSPCLKRFPMVNRLQFYIDGAWVDPAVKKSTPVVNPATEEAMYEVALGSKADVDKAVKAAKRAFETFSQTSREERVALLEKIIEVYKTRMKDIGAAVSDEMGAPLPMAERLQAGAGLGHIAATLEVLKNYHFEENLGTAVVVREPVGVVGMITPWNWPLNQIACKVAPALAAGCTMILKPSEFTPSSALIFAEILHEAGVPKGVFNLVNGLGPEVGAAMSEHPDIDMISFTGSTRAGVDVAKRAAPTVKRVTQELGGKSPNIILEDAELSKSIAGGTAHCFNNSGQSCNAPTRMLVPLAKMKEAAAIAKGVADKAKVGDPRGSDTTMGPVVNRVQR